MYLICLFGVEGRESLSLIQNTHSIFIPRRNMATDTHSFYEDTTSSTSPRRVKPYPPHLVDNFNMQYSSTRPSSESTVTTTAPSSPNCHYPFMAASHPHRPSPIKRIINRIRLAHYRYEVTLPIYSMTIGEKLVINSFMFLFFSLTAWALFLYFPSLIYQKLSRLDWLFTGRDTIDVGPYVILPANNRNWTALSLVKASPLRSYLWDMVLVLGLIFSIVTLLNP